jgi:hypothetical protein
MNPSVVLQATRPVARDTVTTAVSSPGGVLKRILWLYGLYSLLNNALFVFGYYVLPEGFFRRTVFTASGEAASSPGSFWGQFVVTLLFNIGWMVGLSVVLNINQVRGFPVGFLMPVTLGIFGGLIAGSNSFVASDLDAYGARDGMVLGLSIGGLEMLGYILVVASTVPCALYQYRSWWRWHGEYEPVKLKRFRDIRLSRTEAVTLVVGVILIIAAAYRETQMAFHLL